MKKRVLLITIIALIFVLIGGIFFLQRNKKSVFSSELKNDVYFTAQPRTIKNTVTFSGSVDAEKKATLRFQASGKLAWVGVKEGDSVKQGQAIASLDQRELQKRLDQSLLDYMDTRWDFEQDKEDNESAFTGDWNKYTSDKITRIVQRSQFGLDKSVISVEIANLNREIGLLISPFAGIVAKVTQKFPGVNITPAQAEFEIVDPTTLYLAVTVDQQDVVYLKEKMVARVIFDAFPENEVSGVITYVSFSPSPGEDHSYLVKVELPPTIEEKLRIGMSADVDIVTQTKKSVIAIPLNALSEDAGKTYVRIKKDGNITKTPVTIGLTTDTDAEILKGVSSGDVVVISP